MHLTFFWGRQARCTTRSFWTVAPSRPAPRCWPVAAKWLLRICAAAVAVVALGPPVRQAGGAAAANHAASPSRSPARSPSRLVQAARPTPTAAPPHLVPWRLSQAAKRVVPAMAQVARLVATACRATRVLRLLDPWAAMAAARVAVLVDVAVLVGLPPQTAAAVVVAAVLTAPLAMQAAPAARATCRFHGWRAHEGRNHRKQPGGQRHRGRAHRDRRRSALCNRPRPAVVAWCTRRAAPGCCGHWLDLDC